MQTYKINIIKTIGIVSAVSALYVLLPTYWKHWIWYFKFPEATALSGPGMVIVTVLFDAVLCSKIVVGVGLFCRKYWAWCLALPVFGIDFLMRFVGFINYRRAVASLPEIPAESVTETFRLWPGWITAIISLASFIILLRIPIRGILLRGNNA